MLYLTLELTDKGFEDLEQVFAIVAGFVSKLRREPAPEWHWEEMRKMCELEFQFQQRKDPWNLISKLIEDIDKENFKEFLFKNGVTKNYDGEILNRQMQLLAPENMLVFVSSHDLEFEPNYKEKYFGVDFFVEDFEESWLKYFDPEQNPNSKLFQWPKPNKFIPENFNQAPKCFKTQKGDFLKEKSPFLYSEPGFSVTMVRLAEFSGPKAHISAIVYLEPETVYNSPETYLSLKIWVNYVLSELSELIDEFANVSIDIGVVEEKEKLRFRISGFSDKLLLAFSVFFEELEKLAPFDKEEVFLVSCEKVSENLENALLQDPDDIAEIFGDNAIFEKDHQLDQLKQLLSKICKDSFSKGISKIFEKVYIELYLAGNFESQDGITLAKNFTTKFTNLTKAAISHPKEITQPGYVQFSKENSREIFYIELETRLHTNSATLVLLQAEPLPLPQEANTNSERWQIALMQLLNQSIENEFYNQLRTEEQLGYVCRTSVMNRGGNFYLGFLVQSEKYDPEYLSQRIFNFIREKEKDLENLTEEDFLKFREATKIGVIKKPMNLKQAASQYFNFQFQRRQLESENWYREEMEKIFSFLKKEHLIEIYKKVVREQRAMEIHVVSYDKVESWKQTMSEKENCKLFNNLNGFKKGKEILKDKHHVSFSKNIFEENENDNNRMIDESEER